MRAFVIFFTLALLGCESRVCVQGHYYTYTQFIYVGKIMVPTQQRAFHCDKYVPEKFDGRH